MIIKKILYTYKERKSMKLYGKYYAMNRKNISKLMRFLHYKRGYNIAVWGAGLKGIAFLRVNDPNNLYINTVIDADVSKYGMKLLTGHVVQGINDLVKDNINIILVMNSGFYSDIAKTIQQNNITAKLISIDEFIQEELTIKDLVDRWK